MFERINDVIAGSGSLIRSEAEILATRLVRSGIGVGVIVAGILVALVGLGGLASAGTAVMAQELGWVLALTITSGAVLVLGGITLIVAVASTKSANKRSNMPPETRARSAEAELRLDASRPAEPQPEPKPQASATGGGDDIKQQVAAFITGNPGLAMGGAAAAIALLGPSKTLKYAGRAIMLAQLAAKVKQEADGPSSNGRHTTHGQRTSADARASQRPAGRETASRYEGPPV